MKPTSIFITGGAGFIGSHLAITLAKAGHTVTVYDAFTSSVRTKKELSQEGIRVIEGDILDTKRITTAIKNQDLVYHMAVAHVRLSLSEPLSVHDINAKGTLNTLIAAKKAQVSRFVYVSSSEVYGTAMTAPISETHPIRPTTVYGMSKYMGELYTQLYAQQYNLPSVIVRPFNTYGPFEHFNGVYGEVIPRCAIRIIAGKHALIFGDGTQTRDFTYIDDTVAGLIACGIGKNVLGETVNIARGEEVSIRDIAHTISTLLKVPDKPLFKPARPHDVMRHFADIKKAKKLTGFAPKIDIQTGISRYIEWLQSHYAHIPSLLKEIPTTNW